MNSTWANVRDWLRGQFWVVPGVAVLLALGLAVTLSIVDQHIAMPTWARFPGSRDSARSVLSSIAGAMITFTGLVFSITVLVLQLASQQFSPRVLRTFLRDMPSKLALGLFTATFTYALVVLRQIGTTVPSFSVTFALVLVVASVAMFIVYIDHIANSIRISTIMARVADETREEIERRFPADAPDGDDAPSVQRWRERDPDDRVAATRPGVVEAVALEGATSLAHEADLTLVIVPGVGDFVPEGGTLVEVHGRRLSEDERDDVGQIVTVARGRSVRQDVAFGIRQLVDIAERALSPALNDPTTAVGAIDHLHDVLRRLATRRLPSGVVKDEDGRVRLLIPVVSWDGFVALAVDEIRLYGAHSIQVHRRLRAMLDDLLAIAPPDRRAPIARQLDALDRSVVRVDDGRGRDVASIPDPQGVGA